MDKEWQEGQYDHRTDTSEITGTDQSKEGFPDYEFQKVDFMYDERLLKDSEKKSIMS